MSEVDKLPTAKRKVYDSHVREYADLIGQKYGADIRDRYLKMLDYVFKDCGDVGIKWYLNSMTVAFFAGLGHEIPATSSPTQATGH